jgi:hypothetical protein
MFCILSPTVWKTENVPIRRRSITDTDVYQIYAHIYIDTHTHTQIYIYGVRLWTSQYIHGIYYILSIAGRHSCTKKNHVCSAVVSGFLFVDSSVNCGDLLTMATMNVREYYDSSSRDTTHLVILAGTVLRKHANILFKMRQSITFYERSCLYVQTGLSVTF